jgi:hypothetical protein
MRKKRQKSIDKIIEHLGMERYKEIRHNYYVLQNRADKILKGEISLS